MYKSKGYVYIKAPCHPFATKDGYVRRSRLTVEKHIGRFLSKQEIIHHLNEIKDDDRYENLKVFPTRKDHINFHISLNKQRGIKYKRTEEFCKKMSKIRKAYFINHTHPMLGKKHSPEALKKMDKTIFKKGHKAPKTAFKLGNTPWNKGTTGIMNAWNKGIKTGFSPWKGKKFSNKHRENLSLSHRGKIPWNKGKKMSQEYCIKLSFAHKNLIQKNS